MALAAPQRLEKLVLADTTSRYPPEAQALWPERIRQIEAGGLEPLVGPTLERWFTAPYRAAHPELVARIGTLIRSTPVAGYIGCCHAIAALDFTERLKALNLPTLVLVGDQDAGTPPAMARELAAAIPGARLEIIPGAAHLSNIEQADAFNRQLLAFPRRLIAAAASAATAAIARVAGAVIARAAIATPHRCPDRAPQCAVPLWPGANALQSGV